MKVSLHIVGAIAIIYNGILIQVSLGYSLFS